MKVFKSIKKWREFRKSISLSDSIGFVATMGNLHAGHRSLLEKSKEENSISVMSIFVNPTQFNDKEDLEKYPRTFLNDIEMAGKAGVACVLFPKYDDMYADFYRYKVTETKMSLNLEGAYRKKHFDGVLTIVMKFLMLVKPNRAYFGEKDFQQFQLISGMVGSFFLETDILVCPTVRDENGLALSSRNSQLTDKQYGVAIQFPKILSSSKSLTEIKSELGSLGFGVDYVEEFRGRRFAAVKLGKVRLIDNVVLDAKIF